MNAFETPDAIRANLPAQNVALVERRNQLIAAFDRVPEVIAYEDTAKNAADFVAQLRALEKIAEESRVERKAPYLAAERMIDSFYSGEIIAPVENIRRQIEKRLGEYQRRANVAGPVRGEYGAVASVRTTWEFSDLDYKAIDLEALRCHFTNECLARAVRNFIRAGGRQLPGVRIYEARKTIVR